MYTMSALCIVLCALCLPVLVSGQNTCQCTLIGNGCDFTNKYNLFGKQNRENVALGKPAVSTSTAHAEHKGYGKFVNQQGCLSNNGNRSDLLEFFYSNPKQANCIHTGEDDITPKWTVNLLRKYTILEIVIYARRDYINRFSSAEITVDDQLCFKFVREPPTVHLLTCTTILTGQNVSITKSVRKDYPTLFDHSLNICEFEVWTCRSGYYGDDCAMTCEGCKEGCDYFNGSCGTDECNHGFYQLPSCKMRCGHCKNNASCEIKEGICPSGCQDGWKGVTCTFEVVKEIPSSTETTASTETGGSNLGLILGIIFGVLALLAGLLFFLYRRKKQEEEALAKKRALEMLPKEEPKPPEIVTKPPEELPPPALAVEKVAEADKKEEIPGIEKKEGSQGSGSHSDVDDGEEYWDEIVSDAI